MNDALRREEINLIEGKNTVIVTAIIVLLITIYFNCNEIKNLAREKPLLNNKTARTLEIGITIAAVIIIMASIYLSYVQHSIKIRQGKNKTGSELTIIAYFIALISSGIICYVAIMDDEYNDSAGLEPIV